MCRMLYRSWSYSHYFVRQTYLKWWYYSSTPGHKLPVTLAIQSNLDTIIHLVRHNAVVITVLNTNSPKQHQHMVVSPMFYVSDCILAALNLETRPELCVTGFVAAASVSLVSRTTDEKQSLAIGTGRGFTIPDTSVGSSSLLIGCRADGSSDCQKTDR